MDNDVLEELKAIRVVLMWILGAVVGIWAWMAIFHDSPIPVKVVETPTAASPENGLSEIFSAEATLE